MCLPLIVILLSIKKDAKEEDFGWLLFLIS